MNLLAPFLDNAARWSARTAIVSPRGETATFGDLAERSRRLAVAWRARGIEPGDRVLLAMPLGIDLYAAIAALWRLGAVVVFPEPALGLRGLRHAARVIAPKGFLSSGWYRGLGVLLPELRAVPVKLGLDAHTGMDDPLHPAGRGHTALISFTSGSTGLPKAIARSHGFLAAQNACVAKLLELGGEPSIDLVAFPVFVIANLGLGITSVLPNWKLTRHDLARSETIAALLAERGVTRALVPPSICAILADGPRIAGLRTVFTGGGPVFPDLLQRLADRLATDDIVTVYGSTEAEPIAHQRFAETSAADWTAMREGGGLLAGRPIAEIRMRLMADEIVVTGDHVNKAYLDAAADEGTKLQLGGETWHCTGDAGRLDWKGRLWLLGRKGAAAGRFHPFMVEAAARFWPGVKQVALVPGSDPPLLAIAGDAVHRAAWSARAEALGGLRTLPVDAIPLDRRHRSKIDYGALKAIARPRRS